MKREYFGIIVILFCFQLHSKELGVMSYNVQNLFDAEHGELDKEDWEFLPINHPLKKNMCYKSSSRRYLKKCLKTDWKELNLQFRISQLKKIIDNMSNSPVEFLSLFEVENEAVAAKIKKALGFDHFMMTSGDDRRGINNVLFFNDSPIKFIKKMEHRIALPKGSTRKILEVQFSFKGKLLVFFLNHWPSPVSPLINRKLAQKTLFKKIEKVYETSPRAMIIALGDFNVLEKEEMTIFSKNVLDKMKLIGVHGEFHKSKKIKMKMKKSQPMGTYFFDREMKWNLLDRFFISKSLLEGGNPFQVRISSYKIISLDFMRTSKIYTGKKSYLYGTRVDGVPLRYSFNNKKQSGFSDHFPIYFKLKLIN
jgi:hypothetical protein